jgi:hypothetical protein
MKDKIFEWFGRNQQNIGYVGGACGVLAGLGYALQGNYGLALLWVVVGGMIFTDTRRL